MRPAVARGPVVSYTAVSPLPPGVAGGGLFSVALSLRSPWADVIRHRALWSPEVPQPLPVDMTAVIKGSQGFHYTSAERMEKNR